MMRVFLRATLGLCALLSTSLVAMGCDDPAAGSSENAASALVPYERPAAGVSTGGTMPGESGPGREICLANFDYLLDRFQAGTIEEAGFSSGPEQTFREVRRVLSEELNHPDAIATILEDRHAELAQDGDRDIVWTVLAYPHLRRTLRSFGPSRDGNTLTYIDESICGLPVEERPASAGEFAQRCGDAYVKDEVLGRVYVFLADITHLSEEERGELQNILPFGPLTGLGDAPRLSWRDALRSSTYAQVGWQLYPLGVEYFREIFQPRAWQPFDFANEGQIGQAIREILRDVRESQDDEHPAFGIPYLYNVQPYDSVALTYCHADVFEDELECLHELETGRASLTASSSELKLGYDHLREVLANPEHINWQGDASAHQAHLQGWVDEVHSCIDAFDQAADACSGAIDAQADGDASAPSLCEACALPSSCDPTDLQAELERLNLPLNDEGKTMFFHPRRFEPYVRYFEQHESGGIRGTEDWLCTLNSLSGYFAGGAESALLSQQVDATSNRTFWRLHMTSGRSNTGERLRAGVSCIPRALFGDASFDLENDALTDLRTSALTTTEVVGTRQQLHALSGIGGRLGGLQSFAQTTLEPSSDEALATLASPDELRARVLSFGGLDDSSHEGGAQRHASPAGEFTLQNPPAAPGESSTEATRILARLDEAYCYLTEISGQFDGRTELIDLNATYNHWQLRVRAAAGKQVRASARCVTYDPAALHEP